MGFTFSELARKRELVAMLTSGLSMYRLAAPILIVGGTLNVLALPVQEFIIPRFANKLTRRHAYLGKQTMGKFPVRFVRDGAGNLISASNFHPKLARLDNVNIQVRTPQGLGSRIITASQAFWDDHLQRWGLIQGYEHLPTVNKPTGSDCPPGQNLCQPAVSCGVATPSSQQRP
jgi:lipopolysaccharide export system permease protein